MTKFLVGNNLYVHNLQDLEDIMKDLLKIDGVEKVTRLEE